MRAPVEDHAPGQRAVGHLALDRRPRPGRAAPRRCPAAGWRGRPPAAAPVRHPRRRSGARRVEVFPAKAKPRMAAMATGATRQVITAERSRTRRRSSLKVMTKAVSRRAPDPGARPHPEKLALAVVITLEPVGVVVGGRSEAIDDDWGGVEAVIRLDDAQFGPDAVAGLGGLLPPGGGLPVPPGRSGRRADRVPAGPGATRSGPRWACSPSGPKCGRTVSACRPAGLLGVEGLDLHVRGLDAIDGSPVLDVKPFMREFEPPRAPMCVNPPGPPS